MLSSGESQTSVNKWGMDYYALVKISSDGRIIEKLLESEHLKASGKKLVSMDSLRIRLI